MRPLPTLLAAALLATTAVAQGVSDSTAFLNAVKDKDGAVAGRYLDTGGATVLSARNGDGDTALHIVVRGRDAGWTGFLLSRGADANLVSRAGEPPLVLAAQLGFLDGVSLLLRAGARVDATNRRGETALIAAVQSANLPGARSALPVVQRLLRAGADPNKTDAAAGYSALDYARQDRRSAAIVRALEDSAASKIASPAPARQTVAPVPPVVAPSGARPPAIANGTTLAGLVRIDDYPDAARARRERGTAGVRLQVATNGRVEGCTVTQTSGSSTLDMATCRVLRSRSRFEPARDASGAPVAGAFDARITWGPDGVIAAP